MQAGNLPEFFIFIRRDRVKERGKGYAKEKGNIF